MAFPATALITKVEAAPGADLTADPATWPWVDITAYVRGRVTIHRGREDTNSDVGPSSCTFRLANDDFRFTPGHPLGAYWPDWRRGTPIRASLDPGSGLVKRFTGEMRECDPVVPDGGSELTEVQVTAFGILHRLGQGQVLDSALRRALLHDTTSGVLPVAYWSMEDASGALSFGSAVGGPPMAFSNWQPSADSSIAGSLPLPQAQSNAIFSAGIPSYPVPGTPQWAVCWAMRLPAAPTQTTGLMAWSTGGTVATWALRVTTSGTVYLEARNAAGTELLGDVGISLSPFPYGAQLWIQVNAAQVGSNIDWGYEISSATGTGNNRLGTLTGATVGNLTSVWHSASPGLTAGGYTIGHVAVATDTSYGTFTDAAARGFSGEGAADRFSRLCDEEHVAQAVNGSAGTGSQMGAQQTGTLLTLLRECEDAEVGLIYEATDGKLTLRTRAERYNRTPTLALDCDRGHVKLGFAPTDDDSRLVNRETVSRTNGGSASYADVDVRDGTYPDSKTLNVQGDWTLRHHASWRVHLGTVDEMRIPSLNINLQSNPELIAQWLATDIGDWLTAANLPPQYPPGTASQVLEGYTEVFDAATWSATLNDSPTRAWEVFQVEDPARGRVDTEGSTLTADAPAGATTLTVATSRGARWITTAGQPSMFPFDVEVAGLRVRVTAIATAVLNANPYFETDASNWTAAGCTLARSTARAHQGTASLLITPSGTSAKAEADSEQVPVSVGHTCTASAWVYCTVARTAFITINWFDGTGAYIGTAPLVDVSLAANTWTLISQPALTPAGAAKVNIAVGMRSTPPASNLLYVDEVTLTDPLTQTFTVTRSMDGVDKLLPAGSAVKLWRPGAIAL